MNYKPFSILTIEEREDAMGYDQKALYERMIDFMQEIGSSSLEVTEEECLYAFKTAREKTGYFMEEQK